MAVQMASSPTQDMINFGVSTGGETQVGKHGEAGVGVFADSASQQSFASTLESMARAGKRGDKEGKTLLSGKATEAVCAEGIAEFAELHSGKSEMALWWRSALECLESESEVDIEALIASYATREKKGRFDPDAILKEAGTSAQADSEQQTDAVAPESDETNDEIPAAIGDEDILNAAALLAAQAVAEIATDEAEPSELPEVPSAGTEEIEQASSGSVNADKIFTTSELLPKEDIEDVKHLPKSDGADALGATEAVTDDATEGDIDVDVVDAIDSPKPQQEPKQESEPAQTVRAETGQLPSVRDVSPQNEKTKPETDASIVAETTDESDDIAVSPDAPVAKKPDNATEDTAKTEDGKQSTSESIEELLARYRQERESRQDDSSGRGSSNQSRRDRNASTASSQARNQRTEAQTYAATREARDDAPRASAFATDLNSAVKNVRDELHPEQSASANRSGASPYVLNRELAFTDGVRTVLEFMRTDGTSEARIVVEPPALGHIDVSLRATSAGMEATFKVDNEHLKQMLQQQLDILKSSLQSQGIHVSALAVDIRNRDDQKGREAAGGGGKKSRHSGGPDDLDGIAEGETNILRLDLEKGLLHWVA